jgi:hypothetical protein
MSNKHDNIYNILGKLDALTPKQAPVEQTPAKTINESVEARGSVLEGVAKVEARLSEMFNQQAMAEAAPVDYEKVLEAIAALYGDDMWDNDAMGDLAQDLEQAGPTDRELDFIIAKGKLPTRLKGIRFTNTDDVQFGHLGEKSDWSNLGAEYRTTKPGTKEPTHTGEKEYFKGGVRHTKDYDREVSHTAATGEKRGRGRPKKSQFESSIQESINFAEMMKEQHQTVDEYLMELQADIAEFKKSGHMSEKLRDSLEMHKFTKKQLTDAAKQPELPVAVIAPAPKPPSMMQRAGSAIASGMKSAAGAVNKVIGHPSDEEMLAKLKKDTMGEELNELARLAGLNESLKGGQKNLDKNKNGKLDSDDFKRLRDKVSEASVDEDMVKAKDDYDGDGKKESPKAEYMGSKDKAIKKAMSQDLDEETHGQYLAQKEKEAETSGKKSFQAFKQTHPVDGKPGVEEEMEEESLEEAKLPMKTVNGKKVPAFAADGKGKNDLEKEKVDECGPEMSPFSAMGQQESESGMNINTSMDTKTGRKSVTVSAEGEAAEELAQMLKMAGMGSRSQQPQAVVVATGPEETVEEEREGQYANTPDEEVENIDTIMRQGNDLHREKEQYADKPKAGDNPMATRESIEMPKSLSKMLEGIKMVEAEKCNHTAEGKECPVHGMKECSYMEEGIVDWGKEKYHEYQTGRQWNKFDKAQRKGDQAGMQAADAAAHAHRDQLQATRLKRTGSTLAKNSNYGMDQDRANIAALQKKGMVPQNYGRVAEEAKPSAGMSKGEKSSLVKKAQAGGDIGKPGKSFDKVAKAAGGGEKGKRIAAAAMWKNAAK